VSARAWALALSALALGLLGVDRPPGLGEVVAVRHWSYPDFTRVVIELDRAVGAEVRRLPADPAARRPERLYLDLPGVWVGRGYAEGIAVNDDLLQGVRLGQNTLETTRVVIDLLRYDHHRVLMLSHPDRVVIDVYGGRGSARGSRAGEAGRGEPLPAGLRPVTTVVVDPGHGGRDPGAIGVGGLREKDVTLRIARSLGAALEARGFRVIYTRRDDRSMSLEERTAIAESVDGDVFISVHANSAPRRSVSGVEIYYLDQEHERHSLQLAARENGIPPNEVNVLQKTLARLHMEEISPHSRRVAEAVQDRITRGQPESRRPQDLGVKKGPFYVLFLSNMPAILVETGFLTNRSEAERLRDPAYVDSLAERMAEGVDRYRDDQATRLALQP
jgi:N-acetylmuramoyl-L-alanine amidase